MKKVKILMSLAILVVGLSCCGKDELPNKLEAPDTTTPSSWKSVNSNMELFDKNLEKLLDKAGK